MHFRRATHQAAWLPTEGNKIIQRGTLEKKKKKNSAGNISCTLMYTAGTEGKRNAHFFFIILSFSIYHPSTCIRVTPTRSNSLRAQSPTATVGSFRTPDYTYTSVDDCNTVSRIKQQRRRQHLATPKTFLSHDSAIRKINRKITSLAITSLPTRLDQHIVAYCWVTRCCHELHRCSVYGSIG